MENIECAELICDILGEHELSENEIEALCFARRKVMCDESKIGEYKCQVPIIFSPQSGMKEICVDTCLQSEVFNLIKNYGVRTVGCCCGHGVKQPYIQVDNRSTKIMEELGYSKLPLDEYGNVVNCYAPKTNL